MPSTTIFLTTKNNDIMVAEMYFVKRMNQSEIAETLNVSQQYVSKLVIKYRKIIKENLKK